MGLNIKKVGQDIEAGIGQIGASAKLMGAVGKAFVGNLFGADVRKLKRKWKDEQGTRQITSDGYMKIKK